MRAGARALAAAAWLMASPGWGQVQDPAEASTEPDDDDVAPDPVLGGDKPAEDTLPGQGAPDEPPTLAQVDILYTTPGCFSSGSTSLPLTGQLEEALRGSHTRVRGGSISVGVVGDKTRALIPEPFTRFGAIEAVLSGAGELSRTVVEADIPVLVTPFEQFFQAPFHGHADVISAAEREMLKERPGVELARIRADLVRYEANGKAMLALEPRGTAERPLARDPHAYAVLPSYRLTVESDDDEVAVYSIGKRHGTAARKKAELDELRAASPAERSILVHTGGGVDEGNLEKCGQALSALGYHVAMPRAAELDLGPEALGAWVKEHGLPYIATNLRVANSEQRPFPRFLLRRVGELDVAFLAILGGDQLEGLSAERRRAWALEPVRQSLSSALEGIQERLGRPADFVVLMTAARDAAYRDARGMPLVDVVIGPFDEWNDFTRRIESVRILPDGGGREGQHWPRAAMVIRGSGNGGAGRITGRFAPSARARAALVEVLHEHRPANHDGPRDEAFGARFDRELQEELGRDSTILVPDLADYLNVPGVRDMVFGERVLSHSSYREVRESDVPAFSDPLWMRVVGNAMKQKLGADVAVARNLSRGDNISGALPKLSIKSWLPEAPAVERLELTGAQLERLRAAIVRHNQAGPHPRDLVFAVGIDLGDGRVRGRRVEPRQTYDVAITDDLRQLPDIAAVLGEAGDVEREFAIEGQRVIDQEGSRLTLRALVLAVLEENIGEDGELVATAPDRMRALLTDDVSKLEGQWRITVEDVALQGSGYANTPNIDLFAQSRETRATTPNLLQLGVGGRAALLYDGRWLGWESGANAQLSSIFLFIDGANLPPQEQRDDVVGYTELRLNAARLSLFGDDFQLVPFARAAIDSEFTATPKNPSDARAGTFPHQILFQQSLGVVLNLSPWLKELRVGLLLQEDGSELTSGAPDALALESVHLDAGIIGGYRLQWPLWFVIFDSSLDVRYLAPDPDDRITDLAVRLQAVNKLIVPVGRSLSVFVFLDLFVVSGKLDANREVAGSAVMGAGLQVNELWTF